MREWYELRVREQIRPEKYVKKSKFYFVHGPSDAVEAYCKRAKSRKRPFTVMWCEKDKRHTPDRLAAQAARLAVDMGVTSRRREVAKQKGFLSLGNELLAELRTLDKAKVIKRRYNEHRAKKTAD